MNHRNIPRGKPALAAPVSILSAALAALAVFAPVRAPDLGASTFSFMADRVSDTRALGRDVMILAGNAEVQADNMILRANRIEVSGDDNQFIDAIGGVWGMETEMNIIFRADRIRYDRNRKIARLEGNATLEDRDNEVVVMGNIIEFDEETEITVVQISVRLFQNDLVARAQNAVYRRGDQTLDLSGFPVVFRGDDEFRADRIRVDLETNDVTMEGAVTGTIRN